MKYLIAFCCIVVYGSCAEKKCTYTTLKLIMAISGHEMDNKPVFSHYVLANGLYRECLDSALLMERVKDYLTYTLRDTPIVSIHVYNSLNGYDSGESSSQPKRFFRNEILRIDIDTATHLFTNFTFLDSDREKIYSGPNWYYRAK